MTSTAAFDPADPHRTVLERARRIRDFDRFPGVDELTAHFADLCARYPEAITARRIGTSRLGEPLHCYRIGTGISRALVFAGGHPNEPIGFCTIMQLASELCAEPDYRERLGCTWHLIPNLDPDGTRLNEGWFAGPWDRVHYAENFYRPAPGEQVEWSFPFSHKQAYFDAVIPETLALMRVIDEVRPDIAASLHNAELGGVYYYISRELPGLVPALHAIAESGGLPLDLGEPESPAAKLFGPAVFGTVGAAEAYDFRERLGLPAGPSISGASSSEYAGRHGTASLIPELPYWTHPAIEDTSPTDHPYGQVLAEVAAELEAEMNTLLRIHAAARPYLSAASQLVRATDAFLPMLAGIAESERARAAQVLPADRMATVAEVFSLIDRNRCFRLRHGGMLLRSIRGEVARGAAPAELHRLGGTLAGIYRGWQEEARVLEPELRRVPIAKLVGVQYGATLALLQARQRERSRC